MGRRVDSALWDQRRELVQKQLRSGLSVGEFCRENALNLNNFSGVETAAEAIGPERRSINPATKQKEVAAGQYRIGRTSRVRSDPDLHGGQLVMD